MRAVREACLNAPYRLLDRGQPDRAFTGKCALAVMAKAPAAGRVKTRLVPPLTSQQAAELNACFLRDTVANLQAATRLAPAELVISYTPVGEEAAFMGIVPEGSLLVSQRGGDFGERLLHTVEDLLACGFSAVCLIDSDSPTAPTREFAHAAHALLRAGARAVLGASVDGGYYLIGLQQPIGQLFARIEWSTDRVAAQTLERAREIGLPMETLTPWYDVDDGESLNRLRAELAAPGSTGSPAPHTHAYLSALFESTRVEGPA